MQIHKYTIRPPLGELLHQVGAVDTVPGCFGLIIPVCDPHLRMYVNIKTARTRDIEHGLQPAQRYRLLGVKVLSHPVPYCGRRIEYLVCPLVNQSCGSKIPRFPQAEIEIAYPQRLFRERLLGEI